MNTLTIAYSTHRTETLGLTARLMQEHDVIVLEEPVHPEFRLMLEGKVEVKDHMQELDVAYPVFAERQYMLLRLLHQAGKEIIQVEPFLDQLLEIQYFFAEGHGPDEIDTGSLQHEVYCSERDATGLLLDYYEAVRGNDFHRILQSMDAFARVDAKRFKLRDTLRAKAINKRLTPGRSVYVEAGSIHLLLHKYLSRMIPPDWQLQVHFIEREAMHQIGLQGSLFNPGDELTLSYMFDKDIAREHAALLCAQSLVYAKIIRKDEIRPGDVTYPHTRNDVETIKMARSLAMDECCRLFHEMRPLTTEQAARHVYSYLRARLSQLRD